MIQAFLGLGLPIVAVWAAFRAAHIGRASHSRLLTLALASCVGIGASSAVTFATLMLGGRLNRAFVVRDAILWLLVLGGALWIGRGRTPDAPAAAFPPAKTVDWVLRGAFLIVFVLAWAVPFAEYAVAPHGQWDAWAIWNQKARFMFRAGPRWTDSMAISWSQPSHPPLVSASVARLWAYAGRELTEVPAMLSGAFAVSTLTVVMAALDVRRQRAWVAGAVLIAPWTFSHLASAQTADLPLGLFFIATLVMLPMRPSAWRLGFQTSASLWMAGATAALAAWTKNEGLVFLAASTALVMWSAYRHGRVRDVAWWVAGAAPFLAALAWFKLGVVPGAQKYWKAPRVWRSSPVAPSNPARQRVLWGTAWTLAVRWGGPAAAGSLLLAVGAGLAMAFTRSGRVARGFLSVAAVMVAGYSVVWILTSLPVAWLVQTTFDRLTLQLWPLIVFAACAPTDEARKVTT